MILILRSCAWARKHRDTTPGSLATTVPDEREGHKSQSFPGQSETELGPSHISLIFLPKHVIKQIDLANIFKIKLTTFLFVRQ